MSTASRNMESLNTIAAGDCRELMRGLPAESISACITDPPYNYEFIGRKWDDDEIRRRMNRIEQSSTMVKNIPYGSGLAGGVRDQRWYQRNRQNTIEYENWCYTWAGELFRVLKSGAFALVFNSNRSFGGWPTLSSASTFEVAPPLSLPGLERQGGVVPVGARSSKPRPLSPWRSADTQ